MRISQDYGKITHMTRKVKPTPEIKQKLYAEYSILKKILGRDPSVGDLSKSVEGRSLANKIYHYFTSIEQFRKDFQITYIKPVTTKPKTGNTMILVVFPEKGVCTMVEQFLRKRRHTALSASTIQEARRLVKEHKPNLIILSEKWRRADLNLGDTKTPVITLKTSFFTEELERQVAQAMIEMIK
jgi:hypothetical protein